MSLKIGYNVVDIPDPTGTNMVEKVFNKHNQRQLSDAFVFIKNYMFKEVVNKSVDKAETMRISNYHYVAITEILANVVYLDCQGTRHERYLQKLTKSVEQLIVEKKVVQIVVGGGVKLAAGE